MWTVLDRLQRGSSKCILITAAVVITVGMTLDGCSSSTRAVVSASEVSASVVPVRNTDPHYVCSLELYSSAAYLMVNWGHNGDQAINNLLEIFGRNSPYWNASVQLGNRAYMQSYKNGKDAGYTQLQTSVPAQCTSIADPVLTESQVNELQIMTGDHSLGTIGYFG